MLLSTVERDAKFNQPESKSESLTFIMKYLERYRQYR